MDHLTRPDGSDPTDFHLTRRTAVSMFFAGYALAAVSAEAAPITTASEGLTIEEVLIPNGAPKPLPAYVARPTGGGRHAAVIVVNEIFGIHDYIKDICRRLAKLGYVAIAPDFFYRSGVNLPALTDIAQIRPVVSQATPDQVDGDVRATTAWLKAQGFVKGDRIGITGFCWGGAVVWRSAMVDPDVRAGVAWYGQLKPLIPRAAELKAPVSASTERSTRVSPRPTSRRCGRRSRPPARPAPTSSSIRTPSTASTPITAPATTRRTRRTAGRGYSRISAGMGWSRAQSSLCRRRRWG